MLEKIIWLNLSFVEKNEISLIVDNKRKSVLQKLCFKSLQCQKYFDTPLFSKNVS